MTSFEYIRAIEPSGQDAGPLPTLEPILGQPDPDDAAELDELVAKARREVGSEADASLATPPTPRCLLPSFVGVCLASTPLDLDPRTHGSDGRRGDRPRDPITANPPRRARGWSSPGAVTMSLAVAATLVFGAFVMIR